MKEESKCPTPGIRFEREIRNHNDLSRSRFSVVAEKCMKSRKHTFKNLHSLVQSLTDKPINDKLLVFSDKIVFVWISSQKPRVSKARG